MSTHRAHRCTLADTAWARPAPTEPRPCAAARSQGARHAAPPPASLGLRFRALLGLGFVPPPEPRPCAHCAPSPTRCSRLPASLYAAIEQIQNRRLGRCHREVLRASPPSRLPRASPPPSRPPPAAARVPLSRCVGPGPLAGKNRTVCIPFSPNARKRPPSWQHPPEMHAFRDQDGNILALCIHSRAQSGDSGYMARESCRQGPSFATRNPKPRMARRCCQRRAAFPRQQPAVRPNGLFAMRQRHATRGMAERALRPAARAWPACRMRAPCHLACARRPRSSPPSYTRALRHPHRAHPRPATRCISPCRAGPAAVPVIPVKWCGDTIAHTRKLRF